MALAPSWIDRQQLLELVAVATWTPPQPSRFDGGGGQSPEPVATPPDGRFGRFGGAPARDHRLPEPAVPAPTFTRPAAVSRPATAPIPAPPVAPIAQVHTLPSSAVPPQPKVTPAATLPVSPAVPAAPVASPLTPPPPQLIHGTPLELRLDQLLRWAKEATRIEQAMVVDDDGLLVAALDGDDGEIEAAIATVFDDFIRDLEPFLSGPIDGHVVLRTQQRHLLVTWRATEHGRYFVVLLGDSVIPPHVVSALGDALRDTLDEVNS